MTDKTLGDYKRTTPDPDETTGEALARLQAELARLLDEADAELRDEADGGVAAALIEKEAGGHGTAFWMSRWKEAVSQRDEALYQRDQWRRGSDSWRATLDEAIEERRRIARALGVPESVTVDAMVARIEELEPRPLPPDAITDEARGRAYRAVAALSVCDWDDMSGVAKGRAMALVEAVITEITRPEPPARPEWADLEEALEWLWPDGTDGIAREDIARRLHTEAGVCVVGGEDPR